MYHIIVFMCVCISIIVTANHPLILCTSRPDNYPAELEPLRQPRGKLTKYPWCGGVMHLEFY